VTALDAQAAPVPEPYQGEERFHSHFLVSRVRQAPGQCGADVVILALDPVQPAQSLWRVQAKHHLLNDNIPKVAGMGGPHCLQLAALAETLEGVGADRFEHSKAWLALHLFLAQQAVVHQGGQRFQDVEAVFRVANRFGGFERESTHDDAEPRV
jgi:hypothetical protein